MIFEKMLVAASTTLGAALVAVAGLQAVQQLTHMARLWSGSIQTVAAWSN